MPESVCANCVVCGVPQLRPRTSQVVADRDELNVTGRGATEDHKQDGQGLLHVKNVDGQQMTF